MQRVGNELYMQAKLLLTDMKRADSLRERHQQLESCTATGISTRATDRGQLYSQECYAVQQFARLDCQILTSIRLVNPQTFLDLPYPSSKTGSARSLYRSQEGEPRHQLWLQGKTERGISCAIIKLNSARPVLYLFLMGTTINLTSQQA
jgi:hypothetical protein